ncbi:MAG: hypothetical protein WAO02_14610 [Verrucomicrobiia bacterium]
MTAQEFPFAWRWPEAEPGVMSSNILASLVPLVTSEAVQLNERLLTFCLPSRRLAPAVFSVIVSRRAGNPADTARAWLLQRQPGDVPVFVSWKVDLAVRTTWRVFTDYWDSFCYLSSDGVVIWPESEQWALAFYQNELFEFGRKA